MSAPKPAFMRPTTPPSRRSAKGLADYSRERVERARRALLDIAHAYDDVDQTVVGDCERIIDETLAELVKTIGESEAEGRDAL